MNINTTHLSVDGPLTSKRLKLAISNFSGEDILAHCQPEIKDNASEWEEKRNAFDFMENLQLLPRCNRSSFRTEKLY